MITILAWRKFLLPDVWRDEIVPDPVWFRAYTCFAFTFATLILDTFIVTLLVSLVIDR